MFSSTTRPLTESDKRAIAYIAQRGAVTIAQYSRLMSIGERTARYHIERWRVNGCAKLVKWQSGESSAIAITPFGHTYAELPRWKTPSKAQIAHLSAINEVEHFLKNRPDMIVKEWRSERRIRNDWSVLHPNQKPKNVHFPDAEAQIDTGDSEEVIAIEVQRTLPWNAARIDEKLAYYVATGQTVWFFSPKYDHSGHRVYETIESRLRVFPPEAQTKFGLWNLDSIYSRGRVTQPLSDID